MKGTKSTKTAGELILDQNKRAKENLESAFYDKSSKDFLPKIKESLLNEVRFAMSGEAESFLKSVEFKAFDISALRGTIISKMVGLSSSLGMEILLRLMVHFNIIVLKRGSNIGSTSKLYTTVPKIKSVVDSLSSRFGVSIDKPKVDHTTLTINRFRACTMDWTLEIHRRICAVKGGVDHFPDYGVPGLSAHYRSLGMGSVVPSTEIELYKTWCWKYTEEITSSLSADKRKNITKENSDKFIMLAHKSPEFEHLRVKPPVVLSYSEDLEEG